MRLGDLDTVVVRDVEAELLPRGSTAAEPGLLLATVGPDFTIRIDDTNGQRVQSVPEGAYRLRYGSDPNPLESRLRVR